MTDSCFDSGATTNVLGAWLAEARGIDLGSAPESMIALDVITASAHPLRLGPLLPRPPLT